MVSELGGLIGKSVSEDGAKVSPVGLKLPFFKVELWLSTWVIIEFSRAVF